MDGTLFWVVATLAAIFVGLGKGGVPGISAMAVPTLALVISPIAAAGLLLPVFIGSDVFGVIAYRKQFDRRVLKIMFVAMPIGVALGWATVDYVSEAVVTILIGLIGAVFALSSMIKPDLVGPAQPAKTGPGMFWGIISGFTSFVSHSGAPPYQVYAVPLKMPKMVFAGTVTIAFAYINVIKLLPYWALGQLSIANLRVTLVLMIPAVVGVFAGFALIKWAPEKRFYQAIIWALLLVSLKLLWDGFSRL